jgi:predicted RNase H-like HicB family nuclease
MKTDVYRFTVVIEPCEEGGFFAFCPALPGCHVQGENYEETIQEMREVIKDFIEDYAAEGESIPEDEVTVTSLKVAV